MKKSVIICVDDDINVLETLVRDLESKYPKYDIEACQSAGEALALRTELVAENIPIALYIVDSRMPEVSGIEFLQQVKDDDAGKIMLTAYSDIEVAVEGINTKCIDYYLSKPYGDELFKRVDDILFKPDLTVGDLVSITPDAFKDVETPYFMFDLDKIKQNISLLKKHINPDKILYAVKCNSLDKVLETVFNQGAGFEINNQGEYERVKKLLETKGRVDVENAVNSHPLCDPRDIRFFHSLGINQFCFDGKSQVDNLAVNAPGANAYIRIFNENKGSRFKLNRLGTMEKDIHQIIEYARKKGIHVNGVTFHVGSQCSQPQNYRDSIIQAAKLFSRYPTMEILNIGGGFPTVYKRDLPGLQEIGIVINQSIDEFFPDRPVVYIEPGRFVVGDAAHTCTSVTHVDDKEPVSRVSVDMSVFSGLIEILEITDDGFAYPIITDGDGEKKRYQIVGTTCAGTDIIADEVLLNELKVDRSNPENNSKLFFLNTGAYTLEYIGKNQPSGFNGARIPRVFFVENGEIVTFGKTVPQEITIKIVQTENHDLWSKCEALEYDVFYAEGYVDYNPEKRIPDFDKFEKKEFIAALENDLLVGAMRVIYSEAGQMEKELFPTLDHARILDYSYEASVNNPQLKPPYEDNKTLWLYFDVYEKIRTLSPANTLDLSSMAIKRNRRDSSASKRIITNIMYRIWSQNKKYAFGAIDTTFYQKLKSRGLPFMDMGPSVMYWGTPTTPTLINTHEILSGYKKMIIPYMRLQGLVERIFS
jgi:ornithine decarboxylase